jgi:hypothetical protein
MVQDMLEESVPYRNVLLSGHVASATFTRTAGQSGIGATPKEPLSPLTLMPKGSLNGTTASSTVFLTVSTQSAYIETPLSAIPTYPSGTNYAESHCTEPGEEVEGVVFIATDLGRPDVHEIPVDQAHTSTPSPSLCV